MIKFYEGESEGVSQNMGFSIPPELSHLWGNEIFRFALLWLTKAWPDFVLQLPPPPPPSLPIPPKEMEFGSRALDQNVYSIRCWRWKLQSSGCVRRKNDLHSASFRSSPKV